MSHKVMQHLTNTKLVKHEHTHVVSVRRDKIDSWLAKGYDVIEEGDDCFLVGKPKVYELK